MAKFNIPSELKTFHQMITNISYGLDDSSVFDDFLSFIINAFSFDCPWEPRYKYKEPHKQFMQLFGELLKVMQEKIKDEGTWYDPFGDYYEKAISSHSRRAASGQFFNSPCIVDLMTLITTPNPKELIGKGINMTDPACGSGRNLLSFHVKAPGNYLFGEDIDRTCAMMATCNMLLHGGVGQIVWHDTLNPESYYGGWAINLDLQKTGIPRIWKLEQKDSFVYQYWQRQKKEHEDQEKRMDTVSVPTVNQLELF